MTGLTHRRMLQIAGPLIGAVVFDGIFIGAELECDMFRAIPLSVAVCLLALLVLVPVFGNHGLWAALMVLNATRTVTLWRLHPKVPDLAALA